ncbi:unknown [Crocosphaera subtropica ATCC 51142]|uniref:DUF192 domain-containing protein n=1 Tax=Crocosphaera subtropica (strain ATCC 51142 / BH68) TaxID=43989 RepID=B1WXJ6_CROS5|nr:DUF192 domain-containing protein [Crocosphaera subtropica]ACB52537.1 unknown [Crocosphaera subtropica ATCC 51142]
MLKTISSVVLISILLIGCSPSTQAKYSKDLSQKIQENGQKLPIEAIVTIKDSLIELEVAKTPQQQQIGLMYRQSLDKNRGMIFLFEQLRPVKFWMKNVNISLDMIFLVDGRVKAVFPNVPPCSVDPCPTYGPENLINQVIELPGGRAEELGIEPGDQLEIEFIENTSSNS